MTCLTKPVQSVHVERHGGQSFRVGVADMNGWRKSFEDTHVVHMQEKCGFFGVFDGHGGTECSKFVATRLEESLVKHGVPNTDVGIEELMLGLDRDFLETSSSSSGSTGTFVIVEPGCNTTQRCLRVGNIGDSRVLLGRSDGNIVRGAGTDFALTTDHKPDSPSELERITLSGNHVVNRWGIHRINGSLSVSRAFGDARLKLPRDAPPEEQCVSAKPDFCTVECDQTDFVMLVCDGISEGRFPNASVVSVAAEELNKHGDPGQAATAVCRKALMAGSTDNLTCMIVLLSGGELTPHKEFIEPPRSTLSQFSDLRFWLAYIGHADAAGVKCPAIEAIRGDIATAVLNRCTEQHCLSRIVNKVAYTYRIAKTGSEEIAREIYQAHPKLDWDDRIKSICNSEVKVLTEDPDDGTSKVRYGPHHNEIWLPTALLAF